MDTVYLDTETTGLSPGNGARIVEIAILSDDGRPLLDTLVNPGCEIPGEAAAIHGITDELVVDAPTFGSLDSEITSATRGRHVVIYNAGFDTRFFPDRLERAGRVTCAMLAFAEEYGEIGWQGTPAWKKLSFAIAHIVDGATARCPTRWPAARCGTGCRAGGDITPGRFASGPGSLPDQALVDGFPCPRAGSATRLAPASGSRA